MEPELKNIKVSALLSQFEALPGIDPSANFNEALSTRLRKAVRRRKGAPVWAVVVGMLMFINAGFVFQIIVNSKPAKATSNQKLEVIAQDILFNPETANN